MARTKILSISGTLLPALSDNGTVVTSTEPFLGPAGTSANVTFGSSANVNTGMYFSGSTPVFAAGGTDTIQLTSSELRLNSSQTGGINFRSSAFAGTITAFRRIADQSLQAGAANSATTLPYTLTIGESSRGGTDTNVAGANGTIGPGIGTGTGAASALVINRNLMGASGTTAQTRAAAMAVGQSKTLSNTSATAQTIATITLGSNAGGGCSGIFTLVATDGTNFDSETQSFNVSFVNKATVVTVGTPAITTSTAANNSGSATLGITAVANGNNVDIKVTPVFGTIVPTTVTLYPVITHCTNTVTFA